MKELKDAWLAQAPLDCQRGIELIEALNNPGAAEPEIREEILRIFHDMQGQAGLFGYPVLAALGKQFCAYWRGVQAIGPDEADVVRAHIAAVRLILEQHLEGSGGQTGQAIIAKLGQLVAA
jgi:hypothetical protein